MPNTLYKLLSSVSADNQYIVLSNYKLFVEKKPCFCPFGVKKFCVLLRSVTKNNSKMNKKLYRSMADKKLCGVCGGLGEYFEVDPTLIRLLWVIFTFCGGAGLLAYIVCAIIVPQQGQLP